MDIVAMLRQEEAKLQQQLRGIQAAIAALNGAYHTPYGPQPGSRKGVRYKRTMSAAARAKISRVTKARWAKFRAEKAKKAT